MICSRRLYKGNSYEICLPLKYSGVTGVNIYTDGAVKIPVTPEISGDTLCFEITSEDLDVLADGVLRYELITDSEVSDSNSRFVVKTPEGYSAQTLDNLLEEAYQSGYTAGGEGGFESGYTSGYTDGYDSGYTDGSDICNPLAVPLTFNITGDGDIVWKYRGVGENQTIQYKINNSGWTDITSTAEGAVISVNSGDTVQFRGDNYICNCTFSGTTAGFTLKGNYMSLIRSTGFSTMDSLYGDDWRVETMRLFAYCTGLTDAGELLLPGTTIPAACYQEMFDGCTNLITPPELPATALTTNVSDYCYASMFRGCTSLTTAPELPATTLARSCYSGMFNGCYSLAEAPALPATAAAPTCYNAMFRGCTSLTEAPELPATTLDSSCYASMFAGCTGLTVAPELPATTLGSACYTNMFAGCTSLTTAPVLPATNLISNCYQGMFSGCTGLTVAPELPATTLAANCYYNMFAGCTSLTTAPILPAPTLAKNCYSLLFANCTNLTGITCLATDISASNCTFRWINGVARNGTFYKDPNMTGWTTGYNGIPTNWTVEDYSS